MNNYYEKYGKVKLSKGFKLYHTSKSNEINNNSKLENNCFFTIPPYIWTLNKYLYEFKLKKDIELILVIKNDLIHKQKIYEDKFKSLDYCVLPEIHNELFNTKYNSDSDYDLKQNKNIFNNLCLNLSDNGYDGFFNYIDSEKGIFEIIIFFPNEYVEFIGSKKNENIFFNYNYNEQNKSLMSKKLILNIHLNMNIYVMIKKYTVH